MRTVKIVAFLLVFSAVAVASMPAAAADGIVARPWSVTSEPDFVFIGDTLTFDVRGPPTMFAFLILHKTGAVEQSIADEFAQMDYLGTARINVTVDPETAAGNYTASIIVEGNEVANCTVEILFSYEVWDNIRDEKMLAMLQRNQERTLMFAQQTARLADNMEQVKWFSLASMFVAGLTCAFVWVNRDAWLSWNASMRKRYTGALDRARTAIYQVRFPDPEGQQTYLNPGMDRKMDLMRQELAARHEPGEGKAYMIVPDPTAEGGRRVVPVEGYEAPEVEEMSAVPAEMPVKKKEPRMKERRTLGERFSGLSRIHLPKRRERPHEVRMPKRSAEKAAVVPEIIIGGVDAPEPPKAVAEAPAPPAPVVEERPKPAPRKKKARPRPKKTVVPNAEKGAVE